MHQGRGVSQTPSSWDGLRAHLPSCHVTVGSYLISVCLGFCICKVGPTLILTSQSGGSVNVTNIFKLAQAPRIVQRFSSALSVCTCSPISLDSTRTWRMLGAVSAWLYPKMPCSPTLLTLNVWVPYYSFPRTYSWLVSALEQITPSGAIPADIQDMSVVFNSWLKLLLAQVGNEHCLPAPQPLIIIYSLNWLWCTWLLFKSLSKILCD